MVMVVVVLAAVRVVLEVAVCSFWDLGPTLSTDSEDTCIIR